MCKIYKKVFVYVKKFIKLTYGNVFIYIVYLYSCRWD